jgi:DNA (cytosine-5)-methyltransferase 1
VSKRPATSPRKWPLAVDLFSGCGGLTQGLKDARFRVVGAVEIDELAVETYRQNHPTVSHVWATDIRDIPGSTILDAVGLKRGELDLVAGCPPCQGFSSMTTLNGSWEVFDSRNDLVDEYVRIVDELLPRAVLMENVPGLAKDARMKRIVKRLTELGYTGASEWRILDASGFGVPQRRRRLVMAAIRGGKFEFAEPSPDRVTVRTAIGNLARAGESGDPLHDVPETRSQTVRDLIRLIPEDGGSRLDLGEDRQLRCHQESTGFKDVYGRMAWDRPAPTITGGCFNPSKGRFLHPREHRSITLREAALLQGFPPGYHFSLRKGKIAAAEMIGNAVPPKFVEHQARALRGALRAGESR